MAKNARKQIVLAQNFLRSLQLVRLLVKASSIGPFDTVYEIGAGRGTITTELARIACRVVAIEKDPELAHYLREQFQHTRNVKIVENDFLTYRIPDRKYKMFANIPYNITAEIVRKILYIPPMPSEAYLIMQKEAAEKFAGRPKETRFSILTKPLYNIQIIRELHKTDFEPIPGVDSVLLHIMKRRSSLIQQEDTALYHNFIHYGFGAWKRSLKLAFKPIFTYPQWKCLSKDLHFPINATPTELTFEQWLGLFACFKQMVSRNKQVLIQQRN
jgi:23S rRNA (adenine-N6)-dimethyltransferase